MEKKYTLKFNGKPIRFTLTTELFNQFVDDSTPNDRTGPMHNYLMRAVHKEDKEALKEILDLPGAQVQITEYLNGQFVPKVEIEVGE